MPPTSTEDALRARVRQQAVVAELGRRGLAGAEVASLLEFAAIASADALGASLGKVMCIEGDEAVLMAGAGFDPSEVGVARVPAHAGTQIRYVVEARQPVLIQKLRTETRFEPDPLLLAFGAVSGVSAAIAGDSAAWGVFGVHDSRMRSFSRDDAHFVQAVANVLADALARRRAEDRLRESELRARAVLETTVDGIITIDRGGIIQSFNPAAERIFGYPAGEVIGLNVKVLMPDPYRTEHDDYLRNYRETGHRRIIGIGREVTGKRKDGSTFPLDLAVSEVDLGGRVLYTGIVRDITERRRLEAEVLRISDEERRRIGQDLHDGLGQQLTGIGLIARSLARHLRRDDHPEAGTAEDVTALLQEADELARRLARGLVPVEVGADGLTSALRRLAENAERLFGFACTFESGIESYDLLRDPEAAVHLFRIAQEAVSNAARHGHPDHVNISLVASTETLRLRISDDGSGIRADAVSNRGDGPGGMGLQIMHYRARIIGGSLEVRRGAGSGTVVTFSLPPSSDSPPYRGAADRQDPHHQA
jgi:two-component system, LuxR family, sensor kinase FixL